MPTPWIGPLPPLHWAVSEACRDPRRSCRRQQCGVPHTLLDSYDVALDLASNTGGFTPLNLGVDHKTYLLPLETTTTGTLVLPPVMDVVPIRISIPDATNPEQHLRLATRKAVNLKPNFKAMLLPSIEEFLRGESGTTFRQMLQNPLSDDDQFKSPWGIHVTTSGTKVSFFPYVVN